MKLKPILKIGLLITLLLTTMSVAYAVGISPDLKPINEPFDLSEEIQEGGARGATVVILQIIAGGLLYFAAPIAVIMLVVAAFTMVYGGAETETVEQAKKHLTWTLAGLALIIFSYSLVRIIITFIVTAAEGTRLSG